MSAQAHLTRQLKNLRQNPVPGFVVQAETDLFCWKVFWKGPPETPFEKGVFQATLSFPKDFPFAPPTMKMDTPGFWHPNVYPDGKVCISILHAVGQDISGYEQAAEQWTPVQSVESVLVSVISMISSPNIESPANVDAAKQFRDDNAGYETRVRKLCETANSLLPPGFSLTGEAPDPDAAGLARLADMGLGTDETRRAALKRAKGDVDRAVEFLLDC